MNIHKNFDADETRIVCAVGGIGGNSQKYPPRLFSFTVGEIRDSSLWYLNSPFGSLQSVIIDSHGKFSATREHDCWKGSVVKDGDVVLAPETSYGTLSFSSKSGIIRCLPHKIEEEE